MAGETSADGDHPEAGHEKYESRTTSVGPPFVPHPSVHCACWALLRNTFTRRDGNLGRRGKSTRWAEDEEGRATLPKERTGRSVGGELTT